MDLTHGQRNACFGLFPREHAYFGFWREHCAFHGDVVRMSRRIIRQDQNWILASSNKVPCDGKNEVWVGTEHSGHKFVHQGIVISGRWAVTAGPQVFQNAPGNLGSLISGRHPTGCASTAATIRSGARFKRFQMKGTPMQKPGVDSPTYKNKLIAIRLGGTCRRGWFAGEFASSRR